MPETTVARFEIKHLQILDPEGHIDPSLDPKLPDALLLKMYRTMLHARMFDDKAVKLQRQGRTGTYGPTKGQEASQVGSALAATEDDWFVPSYREAVVFFARGIPSRHINLYWMGNEEAMRIDAAHKMLPFSVPVGSQALHAAGIAMALRIQKKKGCALGYFGDGATSEGEIYEALNFAGAFHAPCVFINQNNGWAISVPRERQCSCQTLAQKAIGAGFEGIQVDGNDVIAVYVATKRALDKARAGKGPTYIECLTYRMGMHTTADDPTRYQDANVLAEWARKDPIDRMRKYLAARKLWDEKKEDALRAELEKAIEAEVAIAESTPAPQPDDMFQYLYADMPPRLREQLDYLKRFYPHNEGKK